MKVSDEKILNYWLFIIPEEEWPIQCNQSILNEESILDNQKKYWWKLWKYSDDDILFEEYSIKQWRNEENIQLWLFEKWESSSISMIF